MSQIQKDLECFRQALEKSKAILSTFSAGLEDKLSKVDAEFNTLLGQMNSLTASGGSEWVQKKLTENIDNWRKAVKDCIDAAQNVKKGREFQNRFERSALVIVFGIVKAGKSTLGNFIRGRAFRDASFDNLYKPGGFLDMSKRPIMVEKSGREDDKTKEWFDENSIESTVSAQLFELPGLVWVDTPGIGAIEKSEDIVPLQKIAEEYVSYADLVVFLCNSTNPGIREDAVAYSKLYRQGKKVVVLITRSDTPESSVENGKLVKKWVPKDRERRRDQENWVCESMVEHGIKAKDVEAMSISTFIATEAIKKQDDELWEGGNIGGFYRKLAAVIGDETILELKKENPRKALNAALTEIMQKIDGMLNGLKGVKTKLDEKYDALAPKGTLMDNITEDVLNSIRSDVARLLDEEVEKAKSSKAETLEISLDELNGTLTKKICRALNRNISYLLEDYSIDKLHGGLNVGGITGEVQRQREETVFEYVTPERVSRSPNGIWETVCSWFGKKYYSVSAVKKKGTTTVDLGFDTSPLRDKSLGELQERIPSFVHAELDGIRKDYFGSARSTLETILKSIENLKTHLNGLLYK